MFADNTKLIHTIHTTNDHDHLQSDLNHLLQWCAKWQLNFNISKCKYIHYGKKHAFGGLRLTVVSRAAKESRIYVRAIIKT